MTSPGFGIVPRGLAGRLTAHELAVYVALTWHADFDDGTCFPSQATLATEAGCSVDTVQRAVKGLQDKGLLTVRRRTTDAGGSTSSEYRIEVYRRADPVPQGAAPPTADSGTPLPPTAARTTPREQHQRPSTRPSAAGPVDALPGMPEEQATRTAADLVAAWVDGYTQARGTRPLDSQIKRMSSSAKRLARDLDALHDDAAWPAGLRLAALAGRDAWFDLVTAIAKYHAIQSDTPWWVTTRRAVGS